MCKSTRQNKGQLQEENWTLNNVFMLTLNTMNFDISTSRESGAGIRSRIDTTACGNAIKILHSRERRFCHNFCSRSPQAEMHIKIYIPPSREYDPESTVPLVGMQSKFYIPASGDFVIISVHRPRERRCTWKFTFPPRENTIQRRQFRLRKCNHNIASPRAEILS